MKRNNWNLSNLIPVFLLFAFLFMSIGYASIGTITGEIAGTVLATPQEGVFITDVTYLSNADADTESSGNDYFNTTLHSNISLSDTNTLSQITYQITFYNNGDDTYYRGTTYDESFYSNSTITYSVSGAEEGSLIQNGAYLTLQITFSYSSTDIITDNTLEAYIKFNFYKTYNIAYNNISSSVIAYNNYPTTIKDDDTLSVTFSDSSKVSVVTMADETLTEGVDYTFDGTNLSLENITGDIVITLSSIVTPIVNANNNYYTGSEIPGNGTLLEDGWEGNTYYLIFGVPSGSTTTTTYTYSISLINNTDYTWTNLLNTDSIIKNSDNNDLDSYLSSLSNTTINTGETLTITFTLNFSLSTDSTSSAKTIVTLLSNEEEIELELNIGFITTE